MFLEQQRHHAMGLYEEGYDQDEVARIMRCSTRSLRRWGLRWTDAGTVWENEVRKKSHFDAAIFSSPLATAVLHLVQTEPAEFLKEHVHARDPSEHVGGVHGRASECADGVPCPAPSRVHEEEDREVIPGADRAAAAGVCSDHELDTHAMHHQHRRDAQVRQRLLQNVREVSAQGAVLAAGQGPAHYPAHQDDDGRERYQQRAFDVVRRAGPRSER